MDAIIHYFAEEKITGIFITILGVLSLLLACIFLFVIKYSFFKGMAIPLLTIGMMQLVAGGFIYLRTPKDIIRVENMVRLDPQKIITQELPRMQKVMDNFIIYRLIEMCLIALGLFLFIRYYNSTQSFWKGFGLALVIQATILLTADWVAQQRGKEYVNYLITL